MTKGRTRVRIRAEVTDRSKVRVRVRVRVTNRSKVRVRVVEYQPLQSFLQDRPFPLESTVQNPKRKSSPK